MSASSSSSRVAATAAMLVGAIASDAAAAQETGTLKLLPFATATLETQEKHVEAGFELQASCLRYRLLGRVPLKEDTKPALAQLERSTNAFRMINSFQCEVDDTADVGPSTLHRFGIDIELGVEPFAYYPARQEEKDTVHRLSYALEGRYIFYYGAERSGFQAAPQVYLRSDRSYDASDTVHFLSPTATDPNRVRELIVDEPSATQVWAARLAIPVYPGWGAPIAFGPAISYGISGNLFDGDASRLRTEAWVYFFGNGKKEQRSTNARIGIAPFLDARARGKDDREELEYGGLLQLRLGTTLLEY